MASVKRKGNPTKDLKPAKKAAAKDLALCENPTLEYDGVEMVDVLTTRAERQRFVALFKEEETLAPEFVYGPKRSALQTLGGFAALGYPSSFHSVFARSVRAKAWKKLRKSNALKCFLESQFGADVAKTYKVELMFDRAMHRRLGQEAGYESPHRDVCPLETLEGNATDILLGGWVNVSDESQYFVGLPGSHKAFASSYAAAEHFAKLKKKGFTKIDTDKDDDGNFTPEYQAYLDGRRLFEVGPGQMIVFPQYLLHEVSKLCGPKRQEQFRLFTCWRLTQADAVLKKDVKPLVISECRVPEIPSDQTPPMFSPNHSSAFLHRRTTYDAVKNKTTAKGVFTPLEGEDPISLMEWWHGTLHPNIIEAVEGRYKDSKTPKDRLSSLRAYGLMGERYAYSEDDKALMLGVHPIY